MIRLTINSRPIEVMDGRTILEACRENGFAVPSLCFHPALKPYGGCRLCMVEIIQPPRPPRLVASCTYPCEADLQVQTDSDKVKQSRRITAELLLAAAGESLEIQALAEELGVHEVRYRLPESDLCILCGLCVRACQEIVGVSAISFIYRGIQKKVSPPLQRTSAVCIACGTCTLICPTGAIQLAEITGRGAASVVHGPLTEGIAYDCQLCNAADLSVRFNQDLALLAVSAHPGIDARGG
jgi:bidirectional [NiFe] hydrogenase diaphorase subunit